MFRRQVRRTVSGVKVCMACAVNEHESCEVVGCDGCAICLSVNPDGRRHQTPGLEVELVGGEMDGKRLRVDAYMATLPFPGHGSSERGVKVLEYRVGPPTQDGSPRLYHFAGERWV